MKRQSSTTTLDFALLGLISQQPRSGYDLRKFFSSTPMKTFSDSPGSIYPALRRLEIRGLVRGQLEAGKGRRERKLFRLTPEGRKQFRQWQARPVVQDDVVHHLDDLMLRFAFMDETAGAEAALRFLKALHQALASYISNLHVYLKSNGPLMPRSGRLALKQGILSYETTLRWSKTAIASYEKGD